jgi:predicted  nucleic acid-binding Zn-ribbon protein
VLLSLSWPAEVGSSPSRVRGRQETLRMSESSTRLRLAEELERRINIATERLSKAEGELTRAMEAITLPEQGVDADNEMIGERLRSALQELGAARQALALERDDP